jgi:hypothetical protein
MKMQQVSDSCYAVVNEKNRPWDTTATFDAIYEVAKDRGVGVEF